MKNAFTNFLMRNISFIKNRTRVTGYITLSTYFNINQFCMIFIFFTITSTAESNWMPPTKTTSIVTESYITSDSEKKDSLPEGVTQDWLNNLRDENGISISPKSNSIGDSHEIPEDPEGDAFQRKIFTHEEYRYNFGTSISSAGDVNGDGYDDIIIGETFFNYNSGRTYIYFGGLNMNTVADLTMTGGSDFGTSVSSAGDVNGDGYSDVIIRASGNAYIYFGGSNMDNIVDVLITGAGRSVSTAGDVNGDGYSDVIIGASGFAYIYFGGESMDTVKDVTITGAGNFGFSVNTAGDVNGDGFSDVIVSDYSTINGRAYIYFGALQIDSIPDLIITNESSSENFGFFVSSAGDVNGDGYSDVIVTSFFPFSNFINKIFIYFGGSIVNINPDITISGEIVIPYSVSSAGDINGDGYSDIIVGAGNLEKAFIYFGGSFMDNIADVTMTEYSFGSIVSSAGDVNGDGYSDVIVSGTNKVYLFDYFMKNEVVPDITMVGESSNNSFGYSVSSACDVNSDGYDDIIVGSYGYSSNTGRAYIYFGGLSMDNIADVTITGEATNNYFGISVSSAGDLNGDGYYDVIVGERGYSSNTGRAYVYFGGSSMNNTADLILTGETTNNYFGNSVSTAGDVNGDGYSDLIVGAYRYSSYTGRAYIYFGGPSPDNTADVTMTGETTGDAFGYSVSTAGDVNGDGYSDVIVGAYYYSNITGKTYIYLGGSSMNNTADVTMTGESTYNYFGWSVSTAGDINSDGYSDVFVGARGYSSNTGKTYIYLGGSTMDNSADVSMTGESIGDAFGISVSTANDVNGDGFSDVIVGAYGYTLNTGRAYIYFGGSSMDNSSDVTMTGQTSGNDFGISVSSAGDLNGDGYSDLIAGAQANSSYKGSSNIYLGSAISAKPILHYVKDIPNDQGGKVKLKWTKSSLEGLNGGNVTNYIIYRSQPPVNNGFNWEQIADIVALNTTLNYYYAANTIYDSTELSNDNTFFKIKALNSSSNDSWTSNILSGNSIDNIAPPIVSSFTAEYSGSDVRLNWNRSSAPDLLNYILFRSVNQTIDPYIDTSWATAIDSTYLDNSPLSGQYYYSIVAQDIHGNYSPVSVTNSNLNLNLTMFIQGFYDADFNAQISDTVIVELRDPSSPFAIVNQTKCVVASDGKVQLSIGNVPSGNYYITISHRNSIKIWSSSPIAISSGVSNNFDFSTASTQAFGSNMARVDLSPLRFAIYSGDENQDGYVNLTDIVNVYNNAAIFVNGYVASDMNGDNLTDLTDVVFTFNNASSFVSAITP